MGMWISDHLLAAAAMTLVVAMAIWWIFLRPMELERRRTATMYVAAFSLVSAATAFIAFR